MTIRKIKIINNYEKNFMINTTYTLSEKGKQKLEELENKTHKAPVDFPFSDIEGYERPKYKCCKAIFFWCLGLSILWIIIFLLINK